MKKHEAIIIRNRGGKLLEIRIIPHGNQGKTKFITDNVVTGSMEVKTIPKRFNLLIEWLDNNNKIEELEQMLKFIFK